MDIKLDADFKFVYWVHLWNIKIPIFRGGVHKLLYNIRSDNIFVSRLFCLQ
jgi:hypothetical protein